MMELGQPTVTPVLHKTANTQEPQTTATTEQGLKKPLCPFSQIPSFQVHMLIQLYKENKTPFQLICTLQIPSSWILFQDPQRQVTMATSRGLKKEERSPWSTMESSVLTRVW